ncbi:MAG: stage III sporulation protein AA [Syntrophomonadaceae bacterium]|nr:stage III sporulation protein AA [Syntrophomonadaceae bacterium]
MAFNYAITVKNEIIPFLSPQIKGILANLNDKDYTRLEEIRLRYGQPLILRIGDKDFSVSSQGNLVTDIYKGYRVDEVDLARTLASISDNSLYAFEEDIKRGFITVPGGHRVGLAGQVILEKNRIKRIKDFSSICFRIAREVKNCAIPLMPLIWPNKSQKISNTLIISPPRCGKTTILRDLARILSSGHHLNSAKNVAIIDERSELAGSYRGIPQLDVGPRTDVLDACPKSLGMIMAIRSLSPEVIVTDEIGRKEDVDAIAECVNAGVSVISSIHAQDLEELSCRPVMQELMSIRAFEIGVVLSRKHGPGTISETVRWD